MRSIGKAPALTSVGYHQGGRIRSRHGSRDDGVQLSFPATAAVQKFWPAQLDKVTVSFVRVDGSAPGQGTVITMKQFRVETTDAPAE